MSTTTKNYDLIKPALTDTADITATNENWDTVDDELKKADTHSKSTSNPHKVTKSQVGLGDVDNTSDASKPVSEAQATAIADAKKAGTDAQTNLTEHTNNKNNPHEVTAEQIGAAGSSHTHEGQSIKPSYIEFGTSTSTGHGGILDFHYNGSTEDFTSRIIESEAGKLNLLAPNGVRASSPSLNTSAMRNISAGTSDLSAGSSSLNTGEIYFVYE